MEEIEFSKLKKERGNSIVKIFEPEKLWWEEEKEKQERYLECILGDVLLTTAMSSYLPAFPKNEREKIITSFTEKLMEKEVNLSSPETLITLFLTEMQIKKWELFGLPPHEFYLMNGLLIKISTRWPLIIDPEQQATNWIQNSEENVLMLDVDDPNLISQVNIGLT